MTSNYDDKQVLVEPYDKRLLTCLFTEQDWQIWEKLNSNEKPNNHNLDNFLRSRLVDKMTPCCNVRYFRVYAHGQLSLSISERSPTNLLICSKCFSLFKFSLPDMPREMIRV